MGTCQRPGMIYGAKVNWGEKVRNRDRRRRVGLDAR